MVTLIASSANSAILMTIRLSPLTALCLVAFSVNTSTQMVTPIIALYSQESLRATIDQVGLVISAFFVASIVTKLPLGLFGTRLNPARVMPYALCLMMLATLLYYYAPDVIVFTIARILSGIAFALFAISTMTVSAYVSANRERAVGLYTSSLALGLMAGPALGTLFVTAIGTPSTILLSAAPLVVAMVVSLKAKSARVSRPKVEEMRVASRLGSVVGNRRLQLAMLAYFSFSFVLAVIVAYAPLYGRETFGFTDAVITSIFFAYFAVTALTRILVTRLAYSVRLEWIIVAGLVNSVVILLSLPLLKSPLAFIVSVVLLGVTHGVVYPSSLMMVLTTFAGSDLFLASSIFLTGFDLGGVLGPVIMSRIATSYGLVYGLALSAILPLSAAVALVAQHYARR